MSLDLAVTITAAERDLLAECEVVIERGMGVFVEVGEALLAVRDNRLYRSTCATFDDYCRDRWGLSVPYANQLIQAARVVEAITAIASKIDSDEDPQVPATESQARELAPLLDDPEEMVDVWQEALDQTEGAPTAAAIRTIRKGREDAAAAKAQLAQDDRDFRDRVRSIPDETIADVIESTQPLVDLRNLVAACQSFTDKVSDIDPESAARAPHEPDEIAAIDAAYRVLVRLHEVLGVPA